MLKYNPLVRIDTDLLMTKISGALDKSEWSYLGKDHDINTKQNYVDVVDLDTSYLKKYTLKFVDKLLTSTYRSDYDEYYNSEDSIRDIDESIGGIPQLLH